MLIGDQIQFASLAGSLNLIIVAIMAVVVSRAIVIYGLSIISNLSTAVKINLREQTVLWWGGLRGSVSIALALSVPVILPGRQEIINIVFGVVLFTLLVQGLTTKFLLEKLDLIGDQALRKQYSELLARRVALNRVLNYLENIDFSPEIDEEFYRYQKELVRGQINSIAKEIDKMQIEYPKLKEINMERLKEQLLDIEADTYAELIVRGKLNTNLSPLLEEILTESYLEK